MTLRLKLHNLCEMFKQLKIGLLFRIVFGGIIITSCEKQDTYDLFPLKVGNEFYYNYYKKTALITSYTRGVESWKVISEYDHGDSIIYLLEQTIDATRVTPTLGDTFNIYTKIQFEISEQKSSSIIYFRPFKFKRYQDVSRIELSQQRGSSWPDVRCTFKADSGMVKYYYHHPPNQIYDIELKLDSIKISH